MTEEEKKQYNLLKKEVNKANQRIAKIEKVYGKNAWAVKKLYNYLDTDYVQAITKSGRISLKSHMSDIELRAVRKAVQKFLNSKTSTLRGIRSQIKRIKSSIKEKFDIDDKDAEVLYETFNEDLLQWLYQYIEPSDFFALVQEAKEYEWSESRFINELISISDDLYRLIEELNDLDVRDKLKRIYDRYVKS